MLKLRLTGPALGNALLVALFEAALSLAVGGEGGTWLRGCGAGHHEGYDECGEGGRDGDKK